MYDPLVSKTIEWGDVVQGSVSTWRGDIDE